MTAYGGLGREFQGLPTETTTIFLKLLVAFECLYATTLMLVKLSILQLYLNLFPSKRFKVITFIIAFAVVGWWIAIVLVSIFQCKPIAKNWMPALEGECINIYNFFAGNAGPNIFTDIVILCLSVRQVVKLHVNTFKKIPFSLLFLTGGL